MRRSLSLGRWPRVGAARPRALRAGATAVLPRAVEAVDRPANAPADFGPEGGVTPAAVTNATLELSLYDPIANVPAYLKKPPTGSIPVDWDGPSCVQLAGYNQNPPPAKVVAGRAPIRRTSGPASARRPWPSRCGTRRASSTSPAWRAIRWVTRVSGFHVVRPVVKLADGTCLVGDYGDGAHVGELAAVPRVRVRHRQRALAVARHRARRHARRAYVEQPDLSKVDEIGFADLLPGSGHGWGGFVNVARIEVFGRPVKR